MRKRKSKEEILMENNIRSGYYKSEFRVKDSKKEVERYILSKNYGETVTNATLASFLGLDLDNDKQRNKYKYIMSKIKNKLIDHGYVLKGISGVGYYILKPQQMAGHCYKTYIQKTMNILDKSHRVLSNTDTLNLTGDRAEEYEAVVELNDKLSETIYNTTIGSRYYDRKSYYDNLREE